MATVREYSWPGTICSPRGPNLGGAGLRGAWVGGKVRGQDGDKP